jgi:hypothetical protein
MRAAISRAVLALTCAAASGVGCHPGLAPHYEAINGTLEFVAHDGRPAVHLLAPPEMRSGDKHLLAIVTGSSFAEGTIQVDVAGSPIDPTSDARGFIGLAFHVAPSGSKFECLYLRPTNGRAEDRVRRNHATQYMSYPDFPWEKLRESSPGVYESSADIQAGVWTRLRVVVKGKTAKLYINEADQPALIVNDLKLGEANGQVALWSHPTTDAYFSRLEVSAK